MLDIPVITVTMADQSEAALVERRETVLLSQHSFERSMRRAFLHQPLYPSL